MIIIEKCFGNKKEKDDHLSLPFFCLSSLHYRLSAFYVSFSNTLKLVFNLVSNDDFCPFDVFRRLKARFLELLKARVFTSTFLTSASNQQTCRHCRLCRSVIFFNVSTLSDRNLRLPRNLSRNNVVDSLRWSNRNHLTFHIQDDPIFKPYHKRLKSIFYESQQIYANEEAAEMKFRNNWCIKWTDLSIDMSNRIQSSHIFLKR